MSPHRKAQKLQEWIEVRRRHHLSHAHVQMARELGLPPTKMGSLDNHGLEGWKLPLPAFIEHLYLKRFGIACPDVIESVEEQIRLAVQKKAARREARRPRRKEAT